MVQLDDRLVTCASCWILFGVLECRLGSSSSYNCYVSRDTLTNIFLGVARSQDGQSANHEPGRHSRG